MPVLISCCILSKGHQMAINVVVRRHFTAEFMDSVTCFQSYWIKDYFENTCMFKNGGIPECYCWSQSALHQRSATMTRFGKADWVRWFMEGKSTSSHFCRHSQVRICCLFLCFTIFVILSLKVTFVFLRQEDKDSPAVCQRTAAHNFPGGWISLSSWDAANENKQHLFDSIYGSYCVNILDDCNGSLNTFSDTKVKEEKLFSVETTSWLTLKHWRVSILCWLHHNNFSCSSLGFLLAA